MGLKQHKGEKKNILLGKHNIQHQTYYVNIKGNFPHFYITITFAII